MPGSILPKAVGRQYDSTLEAARHASLTTAAHHAPSHY
jgi:hypothetical protein